MRVRKKIFILFSLILFLIPFMSGCENKNVEYWTEYKIIVVFTSNIENKTYNIHREFAEEEFNNSTWQQNIKQERCEKLYCKEENGYLIIKEIYYNGKEIQFQYKLSECLILKEK